MSQLVHDGHFMTKLVSLTRSHTDELGRERLSTRQLRAQTHAAELASTCTKHQ